MSIDCQGLRLRTPQVCDRAGLGPIDAIDGGGQRADKGWERLTWLSIHAPLSAEANLWRRFVGSIVVAVASGSQIVDRPDLDERPTQCGGKGSQVTRIARQDRRASFSGNDHGARVDDVRRRSPTEQTPARPRVSFGERVYRATCEEA